MAIRRYRRIVTGTNTEQDRVQEGLGNTVDDLTETSESTAVTISAVQSDVATAQDSLTAAEADVSTLSTTVTGMDGRITALEEWESIGVSRDFYIALAGYDDLDGTVWDTEEPELGYVKLVGGNANSRAYFPLILPNAGTLTGWELKINNASSGLGIGPTSAGIYTKTYASAPADSAALVGSLATATMTSSNTGDHVLDQTGLSHSLGSGVFFLLYQTEWIGGGTGDISVNRILKLTINTPELVKAWS